MHTFTKNLLTAGLVAALAAAPYAYAATSSGTVQNNSASESSMREDNQTVPGKINDAWITTKVKSEFASSSAVKATDINVDTTEGRVTLRGEVASAAGKSAAARIARSVKGVKSVDTGALTVNAMATRDGDMASGQDSDDSQSLTGEAKDTWITTKVKSTYATTEGVDATDISVTTKAGVVMLSGTAASPAEKTKAIKTARSIKGVKRVDSSELRVSDVSKARDAAMSSAMANDHSSSAASGDSSDGSGLMGAAKDTWITTKVTSQFATTKGVDATDISVSTKDGVVTLTGRVSGAAEKSMAANVAMGVKGVSSVHTDELTVASN